MTAVADPGRGTAPGPVPPAAGETARSGGWAVLAVRALRFWLVNYRRTWRGSIYTSVANPVLYLGAMGLGLGTLSTSTAPPASAASATWPSWPRACSPRPA
jgi:hypothetical protein